MSGRGHGSEEEHKFGNTREAVVGREAAAV